MMKYTGIMNDLHEIDHFHLRYFATFSVFVLRFLFHRFSVNLYEAVAQSLAIRSRFTRCERLSRAKHVC